MKTSLAILAGLMIAAAPAAAAQTKVAPLPRLRASGVRFVTAQGAPVNLRGVNLGGWFVQEMWMNPFVQDPPAGSAYRRVEDHVGLWSTIRRRLGTKAEATAREKYRQCWVQPSDFRRIKAAGFNHVRLPFLYDLPDEPNGMAWLRKAVAWANASGLYVVLDMHGAPGRQSNDHTTGQAGVNRFFFDPVMVSRCEAVWTRVAREFGANPGVAAFDLINEPTGAPNPATLHLVYNRLYLAVRKVAPNTVVIVDDGYKGFDTTPHANVAGWKNVAYSLHFYNFDAKSPEEQIGSLNGRLPRTIELRGYRNAPVYVGEFNIEPHGTPAIMSQYVKTLSDNDFSWAVWTFKTMNPSGPMGLWGLYSNPGAVDPINPFADTTAQMLAKIEQTRTERLAPAAGLLAAFQAAAASRGGLR
ncbi:MAG TPA: cellulase family glycosylhydrolase [Armatimonadota bacterium]